MCKFNFIGLFLVFRALYSASNKNNTRKIIISEKIKEDVVISFKNGSYINVISPRSNARGNRAKLYPDIPHHEEDLFNDILTSNTQNFVPETLDWCKTHYTPPAYKYINCMENVNYNEDQNGSLED